ncbi:MAG: ubiquinone/menaquinone biosynthesis methyltransferase [Proteobacteria bacterium]|nr:ubiquinone/menaquinone biosynthesis methyltransferase [Pseudomonadota bacterium]
MRQPFHDIALQYDFLNDLLSFGIHRFWKRRLVAMLLKSRPQPRLVLDIATGTGDLAALFSKKVQTTSIIPLDPCSPMMDKGKLRFPHLKNWTVGRAEALPLKSKSVSIASCAFGIRNFSARKLAFQEIARVLEPGGLFGILEIHPIPAKLRYSPFRLFWNSIVPGIGMLFKQRAAYEYLRDTGAGFISSEDMVKELAYAFKLKTHKKLLAGGLVSLMVFERINEPENNDE